MAKDAAMIIFLNTRCHGDFLRDKYTRLSKITREPTSPLIHHVPRQYQLYQADTLLMGPSNIFVYTCILSDVITLREIKTDLKRTGFAEWDVKECILNQIHDFQNLIVQQRKSPLVFSSENKWWEVQPSTYREVIMQQTTKMWCSDSLSPQAFQNTNICHGYSDLWFGACNKCAALAMIHSIWDTNKMKLIKMIWEHATPHRRCWKSFLPR